ncbi:MAG: HAD family hydrolase [Alphaproteobacteria bacterium]|nr:HAD family hydrolase [Alphaproteobacteria bacterium]
MNTKNAIHAEPHAVFFDWDGTLADSFLFLHSAHNHVCKALGRPAFDLKAFEGYFGQPREKLYKELYGEKMEEARTHFEHYVLNNHLAGLKPAHGAEDLLKTLYDRRIPCGVVSNKKRNLIEAEIKNFGWDDFFISIVGAGEAEADKPSPAPLLLAVERANLMNIPMKNMWFVGDTDNDLLCAIGAECVTVLIERDHVYEKFSKQHHIDIHRNNCADLNALLLQNRINVLKLDCV